MTTVAASILHYVYFSFSSSKFSVYGIVLKSSIISIIFGRPLRFPFPDCRPLIPQSVLQTSFLPREILRGSHHRARSGHLHMSSVSEELLRPDSIYLLHELHIFYTLTMSDSIFLSSLFRLPYYRSTSMLHYPFVYLTGVP